MREKETVAPPGTPGDAVVYQTLSWSAKSTEKTLDSIALLTNIS